MSEHRPFPPSPRRLALARRAGVHGASPHVTTAVAWLAFLVVAVALAPAIGARLGAAVAAACRGQAAEIAELPGAILALALPMLGAAAIGALVAHVAQTRALWLPRHALDRAPRPPRDANHRGLAFAAAIGAVTVGWLWLAAPALAAAPSAATIASAAATFITAVVAVAAIDALLRRVRLHRALAMTHAERREDDRSTHADPRTRALRRSLAREDVAADVARAALILLGDDLAVAIAWDPAREPIPRRTATGERARATQLVALARRYGLPIHRDVALAAELARGTGPVPEAHWARLAEIVAAVRRS